MKGDECFIGGILFEQRGAAVEIGFRIIRVQVQGFGVCEKRLIDLPLLLEGYALGTMGLGLGEFSASVRAQQLDQFPILVMLRDLKGGLSMALLVCSDALQAQGLAGVELIPACTGRGGAVQFMARACSPNWRVLVY